MYQFWKIIRRTPMLVEGSALGGVVLGYIGFSIVKTHFDKRISGYVSLCFHFILSVILQSKT
jgi:hypothetical protein